MADLFRLRIVTPVRLVLDEQVREVTAPGTVGQFGVLPQHCTFLSTLETGPLSYRTDRGAGTVAVRGGFAEVDNDVMTVLADAALFPGEIDVARAEAELREAAARLSRLSPLDPAHAAAEAERQWALAQIEVGRQRAAGGR
jgi:F-type H+-transporting ATPase subunit epsilon